MIVDAHHHLWTYSAEEYGWIGEGMEAIARDFTPADISKTAGGCGVQASVAVQARQTVEETRWLLELAGKSDFIRGVVGWAPLASPDVSDTLDKFGEHTKLKGFRHVVQDEPDDAFILGKAFNRGVEQVLTRGLVYDILVFERQLGPAIEFVDSHPGGRFVLDHIAKPKIATGELEPWQASIREIAKRENVTCKISGVATEAKWDAWSLDTLRPYLDTVLEAFGPSRLMFGSDWPVCLLATDYKRWFNTVKEWATPLSSDEQNALFGGVATNVYRL